MTDFFKLDYYYDDSGRQVFMLAEIMYRTHSDYFIAERVQYLFAYYQNGIYKVFGRGICFEDDFDDFILCYGEDLGVPLRKECVTFEIKAD